MNLRNLAITFVLSVLSAGLVLSITPPEPTMTIAGWILGLGAGIALSRFVVLPLITEHTTG